jgi:hypothetical protein
MTVIFGYGKVGKYGKEKLENKSGKLQVAPHIHNCAESIQFFPE